jgi:phosphatidylinositol alpha-1,6-mannosyltransferase
MVIAALPELLDWVPDALYLVAGTGPDADRLQRLVSDRGLESRVVFAGFVPEAEKAGYYSTCDVFALISRQVGEQVEGFGLSLLEAAACGKPVVAGRHGGALDAVVDGVTGILVDPLQPGEVATALRKLLTDPDLAEEMGREGRQRVLAELNWDCSARQVLAIMRGEQL